MAATEAKKRELKAQFQKLDKNGDNSLDPDELADLLGSGSKGMSKREVLKLFQAVDKDGNGVVNFNEFVDYIYSTTSSAANSRTSAGRNARLRAAGANDDEGNSSLWGQVETVFDAFVGKDCDGKEFAKLCQDCGLLGRGFKKTEADLVFSKVCRKARRMDFEMFKAACQEISKKKNVSTESVQNSIIETGGPEFKGTEAEYNRFHDDKSSYTGAHATDGRHGSAGGGDRTSAGRRSRAAEESAAHDHGDEALWQDMHAIFTGFCGQDCDNREFSKLCKECGLFDRKFKNTDADIVFSHVVERGKRRISYAEFQEAIGQIAQKKGCSTAEVQQQIKDTGGPKWNATQADNVRFHDDKSQYTGTHATDGRHGDAGDGEVTSAQRREKARAAHEVTDEGDASLWDAIDGIFEEFAGKDCDNREFGKLCKDCGLFGRGFGVTEADLVFAEVKGGPSVRRIGHDGFRLACGKIAQRKNCSTTQVQQTIINAGGPKWQATVADNVRFHDDKDTYTGMHYGK